MKLAPRAPPANPKAYRGVGQPVAPAHRSGQFGRTAHILSHPDGPHLRVALPELAGPVGATRGDFGRREAQDAAGDDASPPSLIAPPLRCTRAATASCRPIRLHDKPFVKHTYLWVPGHFVYGLRRKSEIGLQVNPYSLVTYFLIFSLGYYRIRGWKRFDTHSLSLWCAGQRRLLGREPA